MMTLTTGNLVGGMDRAAQGPLVDTHAHVYHLDMPLAPEAWHRPEGDARVEDYVAELNAAGVRYAVLAAASLFGDYSDYSMEAVRAYPQLRTTIIVAPDIDAPRLTELRDAGAVGIRLQYRDRAEVPDLSAPEYQRLLRLAADLDMHVQLHDLGHRLPQHLPHIEKAGPRIVVDHFGRPSAPAGHLSPGFRAVLDSVSRGRTWVKISGVFRLEQGLDGRQLAATLLREAGPGRLLWGSDWPFAAHEATMTYARAVDQFIAMVPDAADRRAIDETAMKLMFQD